ncbi:MAG TPA: alpha/beta fold hydrolase [Mycobacterium sp.]|nr:alpha/beta fold hydrolase [Mycobacterium sp.]
MTSRVTSRNPRRSASVVSLAAVLLVVAGAQAAADPGQTRFKITWSACEKSPQTQCGTLKVPLDWSRPSGATISLVVARRPAKDPARRVGTLFFNPGGPGDGAAKYVADAETFFSPSLIERFDLVGMDPRGIENSSQIQCTLPVITPESTLFPKTEQQFQQLRQHNREVGLNCLEKAGDLVRHMDTISVARDHEALRVALDENKINWLGVSYGTQVAANYAQLYPSRTRAMVLDAALDHSLPEVHQVAGEIIAAEDSFNRFAGWCPTQQTCALRGQDVRAIFDRLVAQADQNPIPVEGALRPVTGEDIRMGTKGLLRFKEPSIYGPDLSWAGLSRAIQKALDGDASAFAAAPAGVPQYSIHGLLANACLDYVPQVHTYNEMQQRLELGRQLAPHLQGASETWQALFCIDWPVRPVNPPRAFTVRGVPALIIHAAHDPSVHYSWAHGLAAQIDGSALLTRTGDGHTSIYTSDCARSAAEAFLVERRGEANRICES